MILGDAGFSPPMKSPKPYFCCMETDYYKTKEGAAEYIKLAEGHNGKQLIEKLKPHLPNGAAVLEIGSGPGSDYEILSESYEVTGSDNSAEFLSRLQAKFPQGNFLELDAGTLKTETQFQGIYSNKVMHHLPDEALSNSVKRQAELLLSGGIVCHSFWKGEGSEEFKGMFVNYHTDAGMRKLFGDAFEILTLEEYAEFEDGDSLLLIARKKS